MHRCLVVRIEAPTPELEFQATMPHRFPSSHLNLVIPLDHGIPRVVKVALSNSLTVVALLWLWTSFQASRQC